jgi:hypothetical protein
MVCIDYSFEAGSYGYAITFARSLFILTYFFPYKRLLAYLFFSWFATCYTLYDSDKADLSQVIIEINYSSNIINRYFFNRHTFSELLLYTKWNWKIKLSVAVEKEEDPRNSSDINNTVVITGQ